MQLPGKDSMHLQGEMLNHYDRSDFLAGTGSAELCRSASGSSPQVQLTYTAGVP